MAKGTIERPTLPAYTQQDSYEVWYHRGEWHMKCTRHEREQAVQVAESLGYPFWAVIRCTRQVCINTVED